MAFMQALLFPILGGYVGTEISYCRVIRVV